MDDVLLRKAANGKQSQWVDIYSSGFDMLSRNMLMV